MEVLERIKPQCLKDLVGNRIQTQHFLEVLKDENFPRKIIALIGPDGCGKTLVSKLIIKYLDWNVLEVH